MCSTFNFISYIALFTIYRFLQKDNDKSIRIPDTLLTFSTSALPPVADRVNLLENEIFHKEFRLEMVEKGLILHIFLLNTLTRW